MPRTRPNGTDQSESDHNTDSATDTESPFHTVRRSARLIAATKSKKKVVNKPSNSEESANEGRGKKRSAPGFDCNICFDIAKEPVVTCCGHLFCWPCLYEWLHVHCTFRECPVCKGSVNESSIVPIYGNGSSNAATEKDSRDEDDDDEGKQGLKVPPRPQGQRIESFRQRLNDLRGQEMLVRGMRQYLIANEFRLQGLERRVSNNGDNTDNNNNSNNNNNNNNSQAFVRSSANGQVAQVRNENTRTAAVNDSLNVREQDNSRSQASTSSTMAMIEGEIRAASDVSLGTNNGGTSMTLRPRPRQRRRWA